MQARGCHERTGAPTRRIAWTPPPHRRARSSIRTAAPGDTVNSCTRFAGVRRAASAEDPWMSRRNHFAHAWLGLIARIAVWAGGAQRRSAARSKVAGTGNIFDGMASREFESLLGEAFCLQGFQ